MTKSKTTRWVKDFDYTRYMVNDFEMGHVIRRGDGTRWVPMYRDRYGAYHRLPSYTTLQLAKYAVQNALGR